MAKDDKEEVVYTKPTSQVDLEARLGDESDPPVYNEQVNPEAATEEGFVGTDVIYQNAGNEFDEPLQSEEGADQLAEDAFADAYGDPQSDEPSDAMKKAYGNVTHDDEESGGDQASPTLSESAAKQKETQKQVSPADAPAQKRPPTQKG